LIDLRVILLLQLKNSWKKVTLPPENLGGGSLSTVL
jgi:hypothetical protein